MVVGTRLEHLVVENPERGFKTGAINRSATPPCGHFRTLVVLHQGPFRDRFQRDADFGPAVEEQVHRRADKTFQE